MRFTPTPLPDVFVIDIEPFTDDRGLFARVFSVDEFAAHGLATEVVQTNLSVNSHRGTLRGFHYQAHPHAEAKLMRCIRGALFEVVVDIREGTPTWLHTFSVELSADNARAIYVPPGCAHAFQTLVDDTHALYQVSHPYTPEAERGLRYSEPRLGIEWPLPVSHISAKDAAWPLLPDVPSPQSPVSSA